MTTDVNDAPTLAPARDPDASAPGGTSPPARMPRVGEVIGHFVVLGPLGRGGGGVVVSAYDPGLDRKVAIKLLAPGPDAGPATLREAQALARLSHPSIVAVHEVGVHGELVYIAMPQLEGSTIDVWVGTAERTVAEIVDVFVDVCEALGAAHAAGIVHCDVKPGNLMVLDDGGVRVLDFGISRIAGDAAAGIAGTPRYMSPEQAAGSTIDARTDQYSVCVALHEAVTGELPGARARRSAPAWLGRVLARGRAQDPADRYPSMSELVAALRRDRRRRRLRIAAIGAVALSTLAGALAVASMRAATTGGEVTSSCVEATRRASTAWSPSRRAALARRAEATGGVEAAGRITRGIDDYVDAWRAQRIRTCRAARVVRTESASLVDLRIGCLEGRWRAVEEALEVLDTAPGATLERGIEIVASLPELAHCDDTAWLLARVKPPGDPATRVEVDRIRRRLDGALARFAAGQYPEALAAATAAVDRAATLDYLPVQAEAAVTRGALLAWNGEPRAAVDELRRGVRLGLRSQHDEAVAAGWDNLVHMLGIVWGRPEDAFEVAGDALALTESMPGQELRTASILGRRGVVLQGEGRLDEAVDDLRRTLELRQRRLPPTHPQVGFALFFLGDALRVRGDREALATLIRARDLFRDHVSPRHPQVAQAELAIARAQRAAGRAAESVATLRRLLAELEAAAAPDPFGLVPAVRTELDLAQAAAAAPPAAAAATDTAAARAAVR